jgi:Protein of unknown function (DUF3810)
MESVRLRRLRWWRPGAVVAALAAGLVPLPAGAVDRVYSRGVYAHLQPLLTRASNATAIAWLDILILAVAAAFVVLAWRDARGARPIRAAGRVLRRTIVVAAVAYLGFLAAWGLNYRRVPIADALGFDEGRVTPDAAAAAAAFAVDRVNALHDAAHAAGFPAADAIDPALVAGLHHAVADLARGTAIAPARPKRTLFDWYFRRAGVDGMTDPFFLETLIASDVLPFERPFVVAHEWSHLAGFTDEGEANFVGWLTCLRSPPAAQYSGWLFLYSELAGAIGGRAAATLATRLAPGPRADLKSVRDRYVRHVNPRVAAAGWGAYDAYLRANRVEAGTRSYAQVVRLALGVQLPSGAPAFPGVVSLGRRDD